MAATTRMDCWIAFCVILSFTGTHDHPELCSGDKTTHIDFVLIGAAGNGAKSYLWQSMFQLYVNHSNEDTTFLFYGCGLSDLEEGRLLIDNILQKHVNCEFKSHSDQCEEKKISFSKSVRYVPLKTDLDFQNFGLLLAIGDGDAAAVEVGRIMYMNIPPSAYASMSAKMWKCCYGRSSTTWNRLVLEKPFGSDLQSAVKMVEEIAKYYKEEEIYRVDHYLWKPVVQQILPFRHANRAVLEPLLTRDHVARVEVVMKETTGVQGRIGFYDQYGIIRDVMQNHLTELLALVAMELPEEIANTEQVDNNRLRLLSQIQPVNRNCVLIGQYADYVTQAQTEKENVTMSKFTPTFGAARVEVRNRRWRGVPFLLVSGKHLDEHSSFIRIVFKENDVCISGCRHHNGSHWKGQKHIIFQIGHGNLTSPGILVSKDLFNPTLPSSMKDLSITLNNISMHGQNLNDLTFLVPKENQSAYVTVVEDMFVGRRESFVAKERLLSMWRIWSPALNDLQGIAPHLYQHDQDRSFNFKLTSGGLQYNYVN